jgi:hypothetical protein
MRAQHWIFLTIAAAFGALPAAHAAEFVSQAGTPIYSEEEATAPDAGVSLAMQDFGGGVGAAVDGGAGSAMTIQMAQPAIGYAPSNAGSNFTYVRSAGGGGGK